MHVVAITKLAAASGDHEAEAIAAALGTTPYEEKLALRGGLPAVVFTSAEPDAATALAAGIRSRGNTVVVVDAATVVASAAMHLVKRFRFDADALVAVTDIGETPLDWADIAVVLRATHRSHEQKTTTVKEKQFSIGRAVATGGLSVSKTKIREVTTSSDSSDPVLYLFHRDAGPPWLVSQTRTLFHALGKAMQPTAAPNFTLAATMIRERVPHARYDDRLVQRRVSIDELDLLAHILAVAT